MAYRGDFTATNAFFWSSAEDLSIYSGHDLGNTPFLLTLTDGAGKKATGYIGAVGAGETLGAELITNPTFDVNTDGWSPIWTGSLAAIDGGQSGKCLEITANAGDNFGYAGAYTTISFINNELIKMSTYRKNGTDVSKSTQSYVYLGGDYFVNPRLTTTGSWVLDERYANISGGNASFSLQANNSATIGLTLLWDEASLKRVTDPPNTAVHIVSSLNGTTRNWASIASGFNPNTIASWAVTKQFERDSLRSSQMYLLL